MKTDTIRGHYSIFDKAELISKYQKLQSKKDNNNNNNQSFNQKVIEVFLLAKSFILKITLLTVLYKVFKKYRFVRSILMAINSAILALFGLSFMDLWGFDLIKDCVNYFRNNPVYMWFGALFASKEQIKTKFPSSSTNGTIKGIDWPSTEAKRRIGEIDNDTRWYDRLSQKGKWELEAETKPEESNNKYYYILLLLLLAGFTIWYFGDEIKPFFPGGFPFKNLGKPKSGDSSPTADINLPSVPKSWWDTIKDWVNIYKWKRSPESEIDLENRLRDLKTEAANKAGKQSAYWTSGSSSPSTPSVDRYFPFKGKEIDGSNLSEAEINRRIIEQATGNSMDKFQRESTDLLAKMNHFRELHETDAFPNQELKEVMYSSINAKWLSLTIVAPKFYSDWLKQNNVGTSIHEFLGLKDKLVNKTDDNLENQSNTYDDVALSTVEEQEIWSDRTNTDVQSPYIKQEQFTDDVTKPIENPSMLARFINEYESIQEPQVKSEPIERPKAKFNSLFDEINKRRNDADVVGSPPIRETESEIALDDQDNFLATHAMDVINPGLEQIREESQVVGAPKVAQPEIKVDSPPTSCSMDQYFPKAEEVPTQPIEQVEAVNVLPQSEALVSKPSFTNLFKDIKSKRIEYGTPIVEDKTLVGSEEVWGQQSTSNLNIPKSPLSDILDTVKGLFTPKSENKSLHKQPSHSNLLNDTAALFDDDDDVVENLQQEVVTDDNKTNVAQASSSNVGLMKSPLSDVIWANATVETGDNAQQVKVNFDDTWRATKNINFSTNNNHVIVIDFESNWLDSNNSNLTKTFDLTPWIKDLNYFPNKTELKEVIIQDLDGKFHSIFKNDKFK